MEDTQTYELYNLFIKKINNNLIKQNLIKNKEKFLIIDLYEKDIL